MADIQFQEEQYQRPVESEQKSLFIRLVLATGIVATDTQAEYVLLGVAVILIILAFLIPSFFGAGHTPQKPPAAMLEQMKQTPINQ